MYTLINKYTVHARTGMKMRRFSQESRSKNILPLNISPLYIRVRSYSIRAPPSPPRAVGWSPAIIIIIIIIIINAKIKVTLSQ